MVGQRPWNEQEMLVSERKRIFFFFVASIRVKGVLRRDCFFEVDPEPKLERGWTGVGTRHLALGNTYGGIRICALVRDASAARDKSPTTKGLRSIVCVDVPATGTESEKRKDRKGRMSGGGE